MQELLTPVQYEPALDMLNQINKLSISDRASLSIDAMQACKNPVGHGNPIIGKFCKEDKQGSLCCYSDAKYTKVQQIAEFNPGDVTRYLTLAFSQQVHGIMVYGAGYDERFYSLYWAVPVGPVIKWCPHRTWIYLPFVGKYITFWLNTLMVYWVICFGIYN